MRFSPVGNLDLLRCFVMLSYSKCNANSEILKPQNRHSVVSRDNMHSNVTVRRQKKCSTPCRPAQFCNEAVEDKENQRQQHCLNVHSFVKTFCSNSEESIVESFKKKRRSKSKVSKLQSYLVRNLNNLRLSRIERKRKKESLENHTQVKRHTHARYQCWHFRKRKRRMRC